MVIPPRYRKWIRLALLAALLVYAVPRVWMTSRFYKRVHGPDVLDDFATVASLLPKAGTLPARFHRGLPHGHQEPGDFLIALWLRPFTNFHGYPFHYATWVPAADFQALVAKTLTDPVAFTAYGGLKGCGGYHADFVARFEGEDGPTDLLLCFGCGDVLIFSRNGSRIAEMGPGFDLLKEAWGKLNGWPPRHSAMPPLR